MSWCENVCEEHIVIGVGWSNSGGGKRRVADHVEEQVALSVVNYDQLRRGDQHLQDRKERRRWQREERQCFKPWTVGFKRSAPHEE